MTKRADVKSLGVSLLDEVQDEQHPVEAITNNSAQGRFLNIPIESIDPNPDQPRKTFDEDGLRELADSISDKGVLQPLIVKAEEDDRFLLVAGERRYRAAKLAGLTKVPCVITSGDPLEIGIIENLQREDLNPIEEAEALKQLQKQHGYKLPELSKAVGKSKTSLSEILSLNKLPKVVRDQARESQRTVTKSVLLEISKLPREAIVPTWEQFLEKGLTVKQARKLKLNRPGESKRTFSITLSADSAFDIEVQPVKVTVRFTAESASKEQIRSALEAAIETLEEGAGEK